MVISGGHGPRVLGGPQLLTDGYMFASYSPIKAFKRSNSTTYTQIMNGDTAYADTHLQFAHTTSAIQGFRLKWSAVTPANLSFNYWSTEGADYEVFQIAGPTSTDPVGLCRMNFPYGYGLGGKKVRSGTAAPTSGTWAVGDRVYNSAPAAGAPDYWRCINATGSGTWEAVGGLNIQSVTSAATVTPAFGNDAVNITAQAAALALANWSGTAIDFWGTVVRIKDNGTARAITYGANYLAADGVTLPTTTVVGKTHEIAFEHNSQTGKHVAVSAMSY
jgi:hypothetical protein